VIAAIEKAQSLAAIARHSGVQPSEFVLTLTEAEAFELLDYLGAGAMGWFSDHHKLVIDIALAKATHDPWTVLDNFTVEGFVVAAESCH
jgi:hypothetical protein